MLRALFLLLTLLSTLPADATGRRIRGIGRGIGHQEPQWTPRRLNAPLWFRADLGITLNGATVSAWTNQGTDAAGSLTQATADKQPTYVAVSTLGGRVALSFDAADDILTGASVNLAQPNFIAASFQSPVNSAGINRSLLSGTVPEYVFVGDAVLKVYCGATATIAAIANGTNGAVQIRVNGAASASRLSGAAWITGQNVGASALQALYIGGPLVAGWNGLVGEVIVLGTMPSAAVEDRIHAYMRVRYGLW